MSGLVVYTTVYPGVEEYLGDWYESVRTQSDQDFDLWIATDILSPDEVMQIASIDRPVNFIEARVGATPSEIRSHAFQVITDTADGIVMVDSDDILHATRVAQARAGLTRCDLTACGLRFVDRHGNPIGAEFGLSNGEDPEDTFPAANVFGLSNTAYRSEALRRCLPVPSNTVAVDWFLASHVWLRRGKIEFDRSVLMDYRQHGTNVTRVIPPFDEAQVSTDTMIVRQHLASVAERSDASFDNDRFARVLEAMQHVQAFDEAVVASPDLLRRYVSELNQLRGPWYWWSHVAHPGLSSMWSTGASNH
jgi:hypothetical protein